MVLSLLLWGRTAPIGIIFLGFSLVASVSNHRKFENFNIQKNLTIRTFLKR